MIAKTQVTNGMYSPYLVRPLRTILGDLPADSSLGICDAHDHLIMNGDWMQHRYPDFFREDLACILPDLKTYHEAGGGWIVDCTPGGAGRDVGRIADASRQSGIAVIAATGRHLPQYYPNDNPWMHLDRDSLARSFISEITDGMDDGKGITDHRAGVIKVASDAGKLNQQEQELFIAAALAQNETGCPIITHTEAGQECFAQVSLLLEHGATANKIILSHCDKSADRVFHRDLLQAGICLEYDQHFRYHQRNESPVSIELAAELADEFPSQIVFGMDTARNSYWQGCGGLPGLAWLATELPPLLITAGLSPAAVVQMTITNALDAFAFTATVTTTESR